MNDKVRKMSPVQLAQHRTKVYRKHITDFTVFPTINGRTLCKLPWHERASSFAEFKNRHYAKKIHHRDDFDIRIGADGMEMDDSGLRKSTKAYDAMERFAMTDYGSSVIKEVLGNPSKFQTFLIAEAQMPRVNGGNDLFRLPAVFPSNGGVFGLSGQQIYDLAIIYHELSHTNAFNNKNADGSDHNISTADERRAVLKFENPVRMQANYEPRYAYYDFVLAKTTNSITGETVIGEAVVSKYDPTIFLDIHDPDVLNLHVGGKK